MSDIIKTFYEIGKVYEKDAIRVKNDAYKYDTIKTYLFDIENKNITPNFNVSKDDLIIVRFGIGANSGNLFPNQFFDKKVQQDLEKFINAILKSCKNLLLKFDETQKQENEILAIIKNIDSSFFDEKLDEISKLDEYKEKGKKTASYFCLSYKNKPISAYFKDVFENHISNDETSPKIYGYDILTNQKGIGGDANLAFCSVNELPKNLQYVKPRLLPLSHQNANLVRLGYETMDKTLSHNFYGFKMAILPNLLSNKDQLPTVLEVLQETTKGDINSIKVGEEVIDMILEESASNLEKYPVMATILFYQKSNAAVNLFLVIEDLMPSFISKISKTLAKYKIKAFYSKKPDEETIFLQKLFSNRLEIMQILLTSKKLNRDILFNKLSNLIVFGNNDKISVNLVEWDKYFNAYYYDRTMESIVRYIGFFNEIDKINFSLKKETNVSNLTVENAILNLISNSEFLKNENLKSAYLLGMLCAATINWQFGVSEKSSFANWLNNFGVINKSKLDKIYKKCDETIRKVTAASNSTNSKINTIKDVLFESLSKALINTEIVKASYITVAFAMGGSDFTKYIKEIDTKKGEENA